MLAGGTLPIGLAPWANAHPQDRAAAEVAWSRAVERGEPFTTEFRVWQPDGHLTWVRVTTSVQRNATGQVIGYTGVATDQTAAVQQRQVTDRLVHLFATVEDAVVVLDRHGTPLFINAGARALVGVAPEADITRDPNARALVQAIRDQVPRAVIGPGAPSSQWRGEVGYRSPDGFVRTLSMQLVLERAPDGSIEYYAGICRDITASKQLQAELAHQATHDALTGLPNRMLFLRNLAEAIERSRVARTTVGVLFLDLDNLKDVNDTIGHEYGDVLLTNIAKRLVAATRPTDIVARIGGDEFVILCEGLGDLHSTLELAERVRQSVTGRLVLQGMEVYTSASVGVAIATSETIDGGRGSDLAVALMRNADTAMYHAKMHGRARWSSSPRRCTPTPEIGCSWLPDSSEPSPTARCTWCTSPSSRPTTAGWSGPRRCCGGAIPSAAC